MSLAVTTYSCDRCSFYTDDVHTWGCRQYVLSDGVRIPVNSQLGWCKKCASIAAIEHLDREPLLQKLSQAQERIKRLGAEPRHPGRFKQWLRPDRWKQQVESWRAARDSFAEDYADAEDGLTLLAHRHSSRKCLHCGNGQVIAPLFDESLHKIRGRQKPVPTGVAHPGCSGQLLMSEEGMRIALTGAVWSYTTEGEFLGKDVVGGHGSPESSWLEALKSANSRIRARRTTRI